MAFLGSRQHQGLGPEHRTYYLPRISSCRMLRRNRRVPYWDLRTVKAPKYGPLGDDLSSHFGDAVCSCV